MKLSIVTTLYQSALHLENFYRRACDAAQQFSGTDYQIVFVNDGSQDASLDIAKELASTDSHVIVVDLSRNFGHHRAMMTGLKYAEGDLIFLIDSDLEEEPEWLSLFFEKMIEADCDVVFGVQEQRKGRKFEKLTGRFFYSIINYLSDVDLPLNPTIARLMSARYVRALLQHQERELYIGGLMFLTGFSQVALPVVKGSGSETTYTLRHKLSMLVNSVTSLSYKPLVLIFYLGLFISMVSFFAVLVVILQKFFFVSPLPGWASIVASIWVACGLIMSSIGILGIYVSKIFSEVKQRPYSIVRDVYGADSGGHKID